MKELSFEKMEEVNGGQYVGSDYCATLLWWMNNNYQGYQGDTSDVDYYFNLYCT
jgi:hypothetical protein